MTKSWIEIDRLGLSPTFQVGLFYPQRRPAALLFSVTQIIDLSILEGPDSL
jgi:hypothetical protein